MSSGEVSKTKEKAIQNGLKIDYSRLNLQCLIDLVSHYISHQVMKFFDAECDSKQVLATSYQLSEQFFENKFTAKNYRKVKMLKSSENTSTCQNLCFSNCVKSSPDDELSMNQDIVNSYRKWIENQSVPNAKEISQFIVLLVTNMRI
jgi:hypothetical protein